MTTSEIIARLDVLEREFQGILRNLRQIRLDLFETLDKTSDDVVE